MVGKRKDLSSKSELNQLYVIDKKSMREIGDEINENDIEI